MTLGFDVLDELDRIAQISAAHGDDGLPLPPPEDAALVREGIRRHVAQHPLYREYLRVRSTGGPVFRQREPWMALGERLQAALTLAFAGSDEARGSITVNGVDRSVVLGLALWLLQATPYLWHEDIFDIASAAPLPKHTISRDVLPYPVMFWSMETAHGGAGGNEDAEWNWIFVLHRATQILVASDYSVGDDHEHISVNVGGLPYGGAWPADVPVEARASTELILKLCSFLASPLVVKDGTRMSRPQRRALGRAGHPPREQDELVNVVRLRRYEHASAKGGDGGSDVEWSHQWWVSGHYRAQWYPSLNAHKVIWIAPHLKGPGDKPLREKTYVVAR